MNRVKDFEIWAFGKEIDSKITYGEMVSLWNKKHPSITPFPETWESGQFDFAQEFYRIEKIFYELYQPERSKREDFKIINCIQTKCLGL